MTSVSMNAHEPHQVREESFFRVLYDLHLNVMRAFNKKLRHLGLTRPQWEVITVLRRINGSTQTEIAEHMEMGRSPLGKIIDKLESMEFVERRADEDDRRINRIFLTEKFAPYIEPMREVATEIESIAFEGFSEEEKQQLQTMVRMMRGNLSQKLDELTLISDS
jgi:MarR family transcriptional regulator for hemolysin